jgi:hypothetical protein
MYTFYTHAIGAPILKHVSEKFNTLINSGVIRFYFVIVHIHFKS